MVLVPHGVDWAVVQVFFHTMAISTRTSGAAGSEMAAEPEPISSSVTPFLLAVSLFIVRSATQTRGSFNYKEQR
jgi:hypothetical protein